MLVTGHQRAYFDSFFDLLSGRPDAVTNEMREIFTVAYSRREALKAGFEWYRAFKEDAKASYTVSDCAIHFLQSVSPI